MLHNKGPLSFFRDRIDLQRSLSGVMTEFEQARNRIKRIGCARKTAAV